MNIKPLIEELIAKKAPSLDALSNTLHACMRGELNDGQLCAFLALMRQKGETVAELALATEVMMSYAHTIDLGEPFAVDLVGTGGDGLNTFNVSTAASIVAASCGAKVAKHGNRSVSSHSGSADVLELAGIELSLDDEALLHSMQNHGLCFLFAPQFHPALKNVRQARQALGIRTFFNLLGPLINPAQVKRQVIGVYSSDWLHPVAALLQQRGAEHALVVHSQDGMDEISVCALTDVIEVRNGQISAWTFDPKAYGLFHASIAEAVVHSPLDSLTCIEHVFDGQTGVTRDMVVANAAAALYCAGVVKSMSDGVTTAQKGIDSGRARMLFTQLRQNS